MVSSASALGRNGLHDWILLRATAIIIALYILYILAWIATSESITYSTWHIFFSIPATKVFTCLALISLVVHGWIGMWQVLTDYIAVYSIRLPLQLVIVVVLFIYAIYGTMIVWSV
ncbi:succinate dehydrogenase, hydrophobic membrane anchor protein [Candidatus Erwinia haradaeae]|uniref:Succinate dehydrogenase hydrophobic membrane anchor subunit n=1 Tax=Candidatus Erwinia haradaeae TaxID=1922217 RepID=A0A451D8X9_9GAMM|nr:succinate dehydrogenase, hydrophobic membrane anchor protein [Candidatus Erwinia haradaeae]VFP82277.1 Succinate dehydrogenase hydrophobic membrane anchor subunit [Candidatus Erwinia haradaeae]